MMFDGIVVGARCAGAATAMLLARRGYRILLVDKARFPSDTLSTHQLQVQGAAYLKKWGLLDRLAATGCPPINRVSFDTGHETLHGAYPPIDGVSNSYCPRRKVLDMLLIEAAADAGAEVRTGFAVQDLTWDGDRVTGIRGRTSEGTLVEERARMVIGADGMRSLVARTVQAPAYNERPTLSCAYYTYWEGLRLDGLELHVLERQSTGLAPTHDGLVCIYLGLPHSEFATFRTDVEGNFIKAMSAVPGLQERLQEGRRADRIYGTGDLPGFFRKPYGPGWALVGDADYHTDPITGQGMSDAFRDADLLASALHKVWTGEQDLNAALAGYENRRNNAALPIYQFTGQIASFAPPVPEQLALFAALAHNQVQCDRFFGVLAGSVAYAEFFSPANLFRIIGPAGMAGILVKRLAHHPPRKPTLQEA